MFIGFGVGLLFKLSTPDKKINAKVVFINQVRGEECCQKGSYDFVKKQIDLFKKYNIPATFVLRYDVLKDEKFITLFKSNLSNIVDYGIFFEITPRLAQDSGVAYKGTEERWYRAQYAYLVGYSQEERKKIIDTAMIQFKKQFGIYPKTTGGWMIDTYSAEYLANTYGVTAHEITREQWGTDGYALYGGSILTAYRPSKKWIFIPGQSQGDSLPLTIIRQTLSDPVRNYGDLTSGYTSQPNDYGRTKGFDYFTHLLRQVEYYSQPLAVLGLENSLDKKYQDMYEKQVEYVAQVIGKNNVIFPKQIPKIKDMNYITGTDFKNISFKAFWIETPGYRARIIQKNNSIQLSDLRVFNSSLGDPYYAISSGEKTAFWETPYVFDSSKKGLPQDINELTRKLGGLFAYFGNPDWMRERLNPVRNENFLYEINGLVFSQIKRGFDISIYRKDDTIVLTYLKENGKKVIFTFNNDSFVAEGLVKNEYQIKGSIGDGTELSQEQKSDRIQFTPQLKMEGVQPEETINTVKNEVSSPPGDVSIIYNAPLSLIGRNPVRLVVVSTRQIKNMQIVHTNGNFDSVKIYETEGHLGEFDGMYYVDIEQKKAGTYNPILIYDSQKKKLNPISFITDCKNEINACLANPQKIIDYMKVKVGDVMNRR